MKLVQRFLQRESQSDSSSGIGSDSQEKTSNTKEDTSMPHGIYGLNPSSTLLSPLEQRAKLVAQTALNKLFTDEHFSICTLRDVIDAIGKGNKKHPSYKQLQALHCVDYGAMPKELREQLPMMVNEVLTDSPIIQATEDSLKGVFS